METKNIFMTRDGLEKTRRELDKLKSINRKEVAESIKEALCCGDITENSEYDQAKNLQGQLEERISKLEDILSNAKIIDESKISTNKVGMGSKILIKDLDYNEEMEYKIVGSLEADPYKVSISNESPLGDALLGKRIGDIVEAKVPDGSIKYKVLEIIK